MDVTGTQPTLRMTANPYLMYEPSVPVTPTLVPDAAQVRVTASGGEFAAFSVTTTGVGGYGPPRWSILRSRSKTA